ncbi:MAG: hypothetical protein UHU19_19800 [Lachnospiraceae bacterium]|nr:hypothetical protein [Lachnospiraceae bacterium]
MNRLLYIKRSCKVSSVYISAKEKMQQENGLTILDSFDMIGNEYGVIGCYAMSNFVVV